MIYDDISHALEELKIHFDADLVADWAGSSEAGNSSLEDILSFINAIRKRKDEDSVEVLTKLSRLPLRNIRTFDNFDYTRFNDDAAKEFRRLRTLSFLQNGRNIILTGSTGTGKTHLAQAIGHEACRNRIRTYYISFYELDQKISSACKKGTIARFLNGMTRNKCLIVDEVGNCCMSRENTEIFFHIVNARSVIDNRGSIILTSNQMPSQRKTLFTIEDTAECVLDRLLDNADCFELAGASYRGKSRVAFHFQCETPELKFIRTSIR